MYLACRSDGKSHACGPTTAGGNSISESNIGRATTNASHHSPPCQRFLIPYRCFNLGLRCIQRRRFSRIQSDEGLRGGVTIFALDRHRRTSARLTWLVVLFYWRYLLDVPLLAVSSRHDTSKEDKSMCFQIGALSYTYVEGFLPPPPRYALFSSVPPLLNSSSAHAFSERKSELSFTMSDVNELLIQPLQRFSKDSMHLIKKCTKPDRKGAGHALSVLFLLVPGCPLWGAGRLCRFRRRP